MTTSTHATHGHCPGSSEIATNNDLVGRPRSYDDVPARQRHVIKHQSAIHIGKREGFQAHRKRHLQRFHPSGVRTKVTTLNAICRRIQESSPGDDTAIVTVVRSKIPLPLVARYYWRGSGGLETPLRGLEYSSLSICDGCLRTRAEGYF